MRERERRGSERDEGRGREREAKRLLILSGVTYVIM